MMNFIRDNIVKIGIALIVLIVVIIIVVACSSGGSGGKVSTDQGYNDMENRLQNAAIKYVEKKKNYLPKTTEQVRKIQLSTLIANGAIGELHAIENSNVTCRGYVDVTKLDTEDELYRYTPYVKCGKYYETKTIANYIIANEKVVTKDEGLYQVVVRVEKAEEEKTVKTEETTSEEIDEEEEEETEVVKDTNVYAYYFKGEYPNNYIVLGERLYRILDITEDNNLKVIAADKTRGLYSWDNRFNTEDNQYSGINDFSKSRLKENLEFIYKNTNEDEGELFFSDTEKEYIVSHDFCVGKRSENDTNINSGAECEVKEKLKVGLITTQDYYRTSTDEKCDAVGKQECNNYNYLYSLNEDGTVLTTLTGDKDSSYEYYIIDDGDYDHIKCRIKKRLYPVIYLDKNILYKSGSGSKDDPYIVR